MILNVPPVEKNADFSIPFVETVPPEIFIALELPIKLSLRLWIASPFSDFMVPPITFIVLELLLIKMALPFVPVAVFSTVPPFTLSAALCKIIVPLVAT